MMTLNLTNPADSEITFEPSKFPDGQQQIKITSIPMSEVTIKSRLNNFLDLEKIICAVKSLRKMDVEKISLYTPYFLGSRSDRQFEGGSNNYLKDVICPIINSLSFSEVNVYDAHSDVLEACLNNYKGTSNHELVRWALQREPFNSENVLLMSPDAGALKKIYKVAESVNYTLDVITCSKSRGTDGKLTKTTVPHFDITKNVIIIDDICDGGATFINIAKIIRTRYEQYNRDKKDGQENHGKIYLIVTHGIFSKGYNEIMLYFDEIYCTNSYKDIENIEIIKQLKII